MIAESDFDTIVAGAGLSGACAALYLSRRERVLVLEARELRRSTTRAVAGLVNPLMGRKARPVDAINASLEAIHHTLALADGAELFHGGGVVRPAQSRKQAERFQEAADSHPEHASWMPAGEVHERHPAVEASYGALVISQGGWIDPGRFVRTLLAAAETHGASIRTQARVGAWGVENGRAFVELEGSGERMASRRLVLTLGAGALSFEALSPLELRGVKGQTVAVRRPGGLDDLPPLSGSGYVVPAGEHLILGSTYEHEYGDLAPSEEQTRHIIEKTSRMVPALKETDVVDAAAGVRVYAGHHSKPYLGPVPGFEQVWAFTGLGSRGFLTAPRLAREAFTNA